MEAASGGCKQTRTDFCNTSYTKLILSGRLHRTRTDFCSTSYTKLTLSGLGHQLSGSLELEPERIFVAPPKRNAHFRVPSPLGLYIIKRDPIRPESGKWTARGTPQHCTGPRGPNGGGDGPKAGDSKLGAKTGNQSWEPKLGPKCCPNESQLDVHPV